MAAYFENFPLVRYGNTYARNIAIRPGITSETLKNVFVYYPYEIKSEMRADLLSHYYYNDPLASWVFYISNNIVDPFFQWYKSNQQVNNLIESKYGSLSKALQKIKYWKVNWQDDDRILTENEYQALTVNVNTGVNQKKYWVPIYSGNKVVGYKRRRLVNTVETNKFISLDTTFTSGNSFTIDEKVYQSSGGAVTAYGFVSFSTDETLTIKNISGTFSNTLSVVGEDSNSVATFTTTTTISRSFPEQESQYWYSVSMYDYEIEQNESMKSINVIDNKYLGNIEDNMRKVFR